MTPFPEPNAQLELAPDQAESLAHRLTLRLARDLGPEEAIRLLPALVRALTGAPPEPIQDRLRREVVQAARRLADLGLMAGTAGNLSVRESVSDRAI